MSIKTLIFTLYVFAAAHTSLIPGSSHESSPECSDSRCKTRSCNTTTGSCICHLPHPSTILDGDRPFLGGRFCDEEMTMCDGTNSFWCEHGGACQEIVQGEKYTCNCHRGFIGERCEHSGAPCGKIFCFHQAECLVEAEGDVCECPPDWKGSVDCSLSTKTLTDSSKNATMRGPTVKDTNVGSRMAVAVALACLLGVVVAGAYCASKFFHQNLIAGPNFQQLTDEQTHNVVDEEDDEEKLVGSQANQSD